MILKMAGIVLIVSASAFLGYFLSLECRNRPQQLRELQSLLSMFENQICYLSDILTEAFTRVYKSSSTSVGEFFGQTVEYIKNHPGTNASLAWETAVKENMHKTALNSEDKEILLAFGKILGSSDIEGQVKNIRLTVSQLKTQEEKAERNRMKYEHMYRNLGLLGGVALAILLV